MENLQELYRNRRDQFGEEARVLNKKIITISWSRLLVFVLIIGTIYLTSNQSWQLIAIVIILGLVGFSLLVRWHTSLENKKKILDNLIIVNQRELDINDGNLTDIPDGNEYADPDHSYCYDLDFFGKGSFFQHVNRSSTHAGKFLLVNWLKQPLSEKAAIEKRQQAVVELKDKIEFRQQFQTHGLLSDEEASTQEDLKNWVNEKILLPNNKVFASFLIIIPIIYTVLLVATFAGFIGATHFLLSLLVPFGIIGVFGKKINHLHQSLSNHFSLIANYKNLLELIEKQSWKTDQLRVLQADLVRDNISATMEIDKISRLIQAFDNRNNLLIWVLLNGLWLWDLQCAYRLQNWQIRNRALLLKWLTVVAEIDALNSLGTFAFNHPKFIFPEITAGDFSFTAKEMGHPLLSEKDRVDNDFMVDHDKLFYIITGANMAGKSTFLRTVGTNMIMAMIGMPVCAKEFTVKPIKLLTSMRTTDSLQKHESYFHAELLRLKKIIDQLRDGKETFIILDEILKGTNSKDKEEGSKKFIDQLILLKASGIIATHDLVLCEMEHKYPEIIKNKSFEVEMNGDDIIFDYRLRDGVCKTKNATFLMEKLGLT